MQGRRVFKEDVMLISKWMLGAVGLALLTAPVFADDVPGDLKTTMIDGKTVITDAKGMTLYTYDKDTAGQASTCAGKCAAAWPPAYATSGAKPIGDFTLVKSADGKDMWAYYGMPLYGWVKDQKPGDTTGDMVGNVWHTAVEK
jgi:predicted lipoprotein with Yx(FWY)xxD motif